MDILTRVTFTSTSPWCVGQTFLRAKMWDHCKAILSIHKVIKTRIWNV